MAHILRFQGQNYARAQRAIRGTVEEEKKEKVIVVWQKDAKRKGKYK